MMILLATRMRMVTRQLMSQSVEHGCRGAMLEEFKTCKNKARVLLTFVCVATGCILYAQMAGSGCMWDSASELNNNNINSNVPVNNK